MTVPTTEPGAAETAEGDAEAFDETAALLADLAALLEAIEWRDVPTVSTYEAAAICARVDEARSAVEEEPAGGGEP